MLAVFRRRWVRCAVGLTAAYFLVLQGTFALAAAAQTGAAEAGAAFVICASHPDFGTADPGGQGHHADDCCLACTLAANAAMPPPDAVALLAPLVAGTVHVDTRNPGIVSVSHFHSTRARAPPEVA
jgi:hypothetical protein